MVNFRYRRKYGSSPFFQKKNANAIAAGLIWQFNYDDVKSARKYIPFNLVIVTNASNYLIELNPNQTDRANIIPPNSTKVFDKTSIPVFHSGSIKNLDSSNAIATNLISVEVQKEQYGSTDIISSVHKILRGY